MTDCEALCNGEGAQVGTREPMKRLAAFDVLRFSRRTGRLTAEERAARLAEMSGNADVHEEARWSRLRNAKAADAAEEAAAEAALQARTSAALPVRSCQLPPRRQQLGISSMIVTPGM